MLRKRRGTGAYARQKVQNRVVAVRNARRGMRRHSARWRACEARSGKPRACAYRHSDGARVSCVCWRVSQRARRCCCAYAALNAFFTRLHAMALTPPRRPLINTARYAR